MALPRGAELSMPKDQSASKFSFDVRSSWSLVQPVLWVREEELPEIPGLAAILGSHHGNELKDGSQSDASSHEITISVGCAATRWFPLGALFMKSNGEMIAASELIGDGGTCVQGPYNTAVRVLRKLTHKAKDLCYVHIEAGESVVEVTKGHRLCVRDSEGEVVDAPAFRVAPVYADTGGVCQPVTDQLEVIRMSEAVQIEFENDESVFSWMRTSRRFRNTHPAGEFVAAGYKGLPAVNTKHSFLDAHIHQNDMRSLVRSRSADW